jgi:hypothetical protein
LPALLNRWIVHATLPFLTQAYMEINYALIRLDAPPEPADTPAERAVALTSLLPETADPVQQLLAEYEAATYSPGSSVEDLDTAQQASRAIRALSWQARIRRLFAWLGTQRPIAFFHR